MRVLTRNAMSQPSFEPPNHFGLEIGASALGLWSWRRSSACASCAKMASCLRPHNRAIEPEPVGD